MKKYYANHFVYELEWANEQIEMLSAINQKAAIMSDKNEFEINDPIQNEESVRAVSINI